MRIISPYFFLTLLFYVITKPNFAQSVNCTNCVGTPPVGLPSYCGNTQMVYNLNYWTTPSAGFNLIFEDNFNGTQINTNYWKIGGNAELDHIGENSCLKEENAFLSNGNLHLRIKNDPNCTCNVVDNNVVTAVQRNFSSSNLWTKDLYGPGRFEIRCKIPYMMGAFPAFWLYAPGYDNGYNHNQEIDVFEFIQDAPQPNCSNPGACEDELSKNYFIPYNAAKRIITTHHYSQPVVSFENRCAWQSCFITSAANSDDFHIYAVEWDENVIKWYYDNTLISTRTRWINVNIKTENFPNPTGLMGVGITNGLRYTTATNNYNNCVSVSNYMPTDLVVDYVKIYSRCQYTKTLCYPSDDSIYNTFGSDGFYANTINFSTSCQEWTVNSGQRLRVSGRDISIKNFHAYSGSDVLIKGVKINCALPIISSRLTDSTANSSTPNNEENIISNNQLEAIIPNPNNGAFLVKYQSSQDGNHILNIWNINGILMHSERIHTIGGINQTSLSCSHLPPGIYFIQISGIQRSLRLVIE
jgi:beta-glucanase (GH16 family)